MHHMCNAVDDRNVDTLLIFAKLLHQSLEMQGDEFIGMLASSYEQAASPVATANNGVWVRGERPLTEESFELDDIDLSDEALHEASSFTPDDLSEESPVRMHVSCC